MNRHDFDILLQKYLNGECSAEEEQQVRDWSDSRLAHSHLTLDPREKDALKKKIWLRLRNSVRNRGPFKMARLRWPKFGWARPGIAALVILGLCLAYLSPTSPLFRQPDRSPPARESFGELTEYLRIENEKGEKAVLLEDGTRVVLRENSQLRYPAQFHLTTRTVYLEGEAFFDVKKDPDRPFMVYTGELVTQVLGTSFNIRSYPDAATIEVQVVSGRVSVYENQQKSPQNRNGIILTPNQKITFDRSSGKLLPELIEEPVVVNPPDKPADFAFEEAPVPAVLQAIQKAFTIEIVIETPALEHCMFTGDLNGLPLHTQLKLICQSMNGSYELRGTTFFVRGEGCP